MGFLHEVGALVSPAKKHATVHTCHCNRVSIGGIGDKDTGKMREMGDEAKEHP